jgi:hypothetical protein
VSVCSPVPGSVVAYALAQVRQISDITAWK